MLLINKNLQIKNKSLLQKKNMYEVNFLRQN